MAYPAFVTENEPLARFVLKEVDSLTAPRSRADFLSGTRWALYRDGDTISILTYSGSSEPSLAIDIDRGSLTGDIIVNRALHPPRMPALAYPGMEVLYIDLLAQERGVLLHACAIDRGGTGIAFVGKSGAGKSTMARLWMERGVGSVLCDDRIIARKSDQAFTIYGTPWHGDIAAVSSASVPLERLYFLRHASANRVTQLGPAESVSRLMGCVFAPWWDREGMAFTLSFLEDLVRTVPCFELGFLPQPETVDYILDCS